MKAAKAYRQLVNLISSLIVKITYAKCLYDKP